VTILCEAARHQGGGGETVTQILVERAVADLYEPTAASGDHLGDPTLVTQSGLDW